MLKSMAVSTVPPISMLPESPSDLFDGLFSYVEIDKVVSVGSGGIWCPRIWMFRFQGLDARGLHRPCLSPDQLLKVTAPIFVTRS
jgi:hypothetical protein